MARISSSVRSWTGGGTKTRPSAGWPRFCASPPATPPNTLAPTSTRGCGRGRWCRAARGGAGLHPWLTPPGAGGGADLARRPHAVHHAEEAGAPPGVDEPDPVGPRELRDHPVRVAAEDRRVEPLGRAPGAPEHVPDPARPQPHQLGARPGAIPPRLPDDPPLLRPPPDYRPPDPHL